MRYLAQRFSFANPRIAGVLTDIGTEELAHLEMIGAIVRQFAVRAAAGIILNAAKASNSRALTTAGIGPSSRDSVGVITMAPPNPVAPRITPPIAATAMLPAISAVICIQPVAALAHRHSLSAS